MNLSQNIVATRIHGTLTVDLEDGRTATIDVDLDVASQETVWGVDRHYADDAWRPPFSPRPVLPDATTFSVRVPGFGQNDPPFLLRIPVDDD